MTRRVMEVTLTMNKAKMSGVSGASSDVDPTISDKFVLKIKRLVDVIAPVFVPSIGYVMSSLGLQLVQVVVERPLSALLSPPSRGKFQMYSFYCPFPKRQLNALKSDTFFVHFAPSLARLAPLLAPTGYVSNCILEILRLVWLIVYFKRSNFMARKANESTLRAFNMLPKYRPLHGELPR